MPDVIEAVAYEAVLVGKNDEEQARTFTRLTEAIRWVSTECTAGNAQQGVVRFNGECCGGSGPSHRCPMPRLSHPIVLKKRLRRRWKRQGRFS